MTVSHEPASISETHVSVVFFVGDRAYKLKKPVRTGFLDYSTREAREAVCHREVELNRRLAPDVYLGVADVTGPDGALWDHLVVMRRMPPDRRLSTLVRGGSGAGDCLRRVARQMAAFHARADTDAEIAAAGSRDATLARWEANDAEMRPYTPEVLDPDTLDRVLERAREYLSGRDPLFRSRVEAGLVRDGHGDLLADDIFCLDDGPRILDCIEFDDRLRWGDVMADVAFLAMDLERLGARAAAGGFLDAYAEFSGEHHPSSLVDHLIAHRAQIRSKVACLRHEQGDPDAAEEARQLLGLALEHLEAARIRLVLVGGPPGTGKSTLASGLAHTHGWTLLRSDEVRKELAGLPHDAPGRAGFGEDLYAPEMTEATYRELRQRAERLLGLGESVVLDASWVRQDHRGDAVRLAAATSSAPAQLRCVLDPGLAAERLRARAPTDPSDADEEVAAAMAARMDPWPEAIAVDTTASPERCLRLATLAVRGPESGHGNP